MPYRGIVTAPGIATHGNAPKVVIVGQEGSGKETRDVQQEVPREASDFFSRDVIEKAKLEFIPFDQSRLRREIKETAGQVLNGDFELYESREFFATWTISQGVSDSTVNTLQDGAPPASSGSRSSVIGLLVMRSLGVGTSSSHRGFVAEFGWLGFGKHPMKDQITSPHATESTKGIRTIIINYKRFSSFQLLPQNHLLEDICKNQLKFFIIKKYCEDRPINLISRFLYF
jgi:hypothetical protein